MDKAFKKIMEGVNPPSGTEGIVCVQITTATGSRDLKCCMIKNNGQCKLLLPQVEHLEKENINVLSACFYDYRKKASYQLEIALEDLQIEEDCRHQFLPFDSEVTGIGTRRFSLRKTKSEKVQSYFETFSKGIEDVERCDLCSNGEKLFGVKNTGRSDRRAEFVELELSAQRKVACRDMSSLYPNGPLFHGKVFKPFQDSNFQQYEVQVVGSYSVVNGEISTYLFVEEQLAKANDLTDGPSSSSSHKESANHIRLSRLLIDVGTSVLRDVFDSIYPPSSLYGVLNSASVRNQLQRLLLRKVLYEQQWNKLYPQQVMAESKNFDITLLFLLLRNICGLKPPVSTGSWDKEPLPKDESLEADLVRIKRCRNELYAHKAEMALTDDEFESNWRDIEAALNRLGKSEYDKQIAEIKRLKSFDNDSQLMPHLDTWLRENTKDMKQVVEQLHVISETITKDDKHNEQENRAQDVESYLEKHKEAIIEQTKKAPKGIIGGEHVQIDDIFTKLIIRHGKENNLRKENKEEKHACEALPEIKEYSEIFIDKDGRKSKRILVSGEPGIGKTMFSQKLIRDLALKNIEIPGVRYTYLIPLRKLTELDNDGQRISLRELLNLCPFLDYTAMIEEKNEAVIDDICKNSAQLFIIFDGWEEFKDRSKIATDLASDDQFTNSAKSTMSVTGLVGRLVNKKILSDSVIMVTSRPGEAQALKYIDKIIQIAGYSESQVFEYVQRYFSSNPEEVKNKALNRVRGSPHFKSFGSVPFRCYLMCIDIEYKITTHRSDSDPFNTLTEFYSNVVHFIERSYNKEILKLDDERVLSAVNETLVNLANLAHLLITQFRLCFTRKDLEELKLSKKQSLQITSSNLITCNTVPGDSPFQTPNYEYSFAHPSFQEFFAAWYFVKIERAMPKQETTEMVKIFSSGLMGLQGTEDVKMLKLLECVRKGLFKKQSIALRCLYEYGKDRDVTSQELTENPADLYWNCKGEIILSDMTDSDCSAIAMLVDKSSAASSPPNKLYICSSPLNCCGLEILLSSLQKPTCHITELLLWGLSVRQ